MENMAHPLPAPTTPAEGEVVTLPAELEARYASLLEAIPEAGGDAVASILEAIAEAERPEDLDAPWRADGLGAYLGRRIVITAVRRLPSEYEGGLRWFLVLEGADALTGERIVATTGSVSVVAQLAKAVALDALPLEVIPRAAERPSKAGYRPQHLEIVRAPVRTR